MGWTKERRKELRDRAEKENWLDVRDALGQLEHAEKLLRKARKACQVNLAVAMRKVEPPLYDTLVEINRYFGDR